MSDLNPNPYFQTFKPETSKVNSVVAQVEKRGKTSIVIPAYLSDYALFHYTGNCIGSIREHTNKTQTPYEIILVLNGKDNITFQNLSDTKADKVIENETN